MCVNIYSKFGEFRETPEKDNPEPSQELNVFGRCND